MISYGRQSISLSDIEAVIACLESEFLTQGPEVHIFEQKLAHLVEAKHAVAVNSGTSALHLACLALGVGPGDSVWTSPITFVASANAALYCGAEIDFVDIDPITNNLCPRALREKLELAHASGSLPKIVIPVHLAGHPCDLKAIHELAREFGFSVIEDAAHALGSFYDKAPVGNCRYSDITIFSFHPVKVITTGEGGAATTNNPELFRKMEQLRGHGITREPTNFSSKTTPAWGYEQQLLGFNYRLSDLAASLGSSQLNRLQSFVSSRRVLAAKYFELLSDTPLELPDSNFLEESAWHLYIVKLPADENGRDSVFEEMRRRGIGVNLHYPAVHLQPFYRSRGFAEGSFPVAESYARRAITLPLHPELNCEDITKVVHVLSELL